jgi:hypothetical protein
MFLSYENEDYADQLGACSEAQNCVTEASAELALWNSAEQAKIDNALAKGYFVLIARGEWRCRATDGVVGEATSFYSNYLTRQDADDAAQAAFGGDPENSYDVLPRLPQPLLPTQARAVAEDDIPF